MAYDYGKKKTLKEKANAFFKKLFVATALVGVVGGAGYYEYGTIQERDVKVTGLNATKANWNYETQMFEGSFAVSTDKGAFVIEPSRLHMQGSDSVSAIWNTISQDKTYRIKTYGLHIAGAWQPNIIELREVTPEELKAREENKAKMAVVAPVAVTQPAVAVAQPSQQAVLSGNMVPLSQIVDGYVVQMTVPAEAAQKFTVNTVKPLIPAPAPRAPGS